MPRRLFTILSALSLLICVAACVLWAWSHASLAQFTVTPDDGTERTIRCVDGNVVIATLYPRESVRSGAERLREWVLDWPARAEAKGLPAELGFYRERRTFKPDFRPGHVFYRTGFSGAEAVRAPLWPLVLLSAVLPATRGIVAWRRRRVRLGRTPLSERIATRWKWILAHVAGSYAMLIANAIGYGSIPPSVLWVTAPVSSVLPLLLDAGQLIIGDTRDRIAGLFGLLSYAGTLAGSLWLLGADLPGWIKRPQPGGYCTKCGYDLRATPGRCPECGNEAGHGAR